jgi:hypothetical protein
MWVASSECGHTAVRGEDERGEFTNVAKAGVISRGVTHTAAWLESQTCSSRNVHGSKVGRAKRQTGQVAHGEECAAGQQAGACE